MPSNPHPLDAAARDELARAAQSLLDAQDADAAVIVTADDNHEAAHDAYLAVCEAQDTFSRLATPDVILALLAAVERGEAETARLRAAVDTALTQLERMRGWHHYHDDENVAELEATLLAALAPRQTTGDEHG